MGLLVDKTGTDPDMNRWREDHPYTLPDNLPDGAAESKASGYISAALAPADWQSIIEFFKTSPNGYSLAYLEPYGGAINRYPVADSAFIHRSVDADLVVDVFWTSQQERVTMEAWLAKFMHQFKNFMNGHVYQNYPPRKPQGLCQCVLGRGISTTAAGQGAVRPDQFLSLSTERHATNAIGKFSASRANGVRVVQAPLASTLGRIHGLIGAVHEGVDVFP